MSDTQFQTIYDLAHRAGLNAANNVAPSSKQGTEWIVIDHTSEFSLWTKKKNLSRKGTEEGREINCSKIVGDNFNSKVAYVTAFTKTLQNYGFKATFKIG